jgi:hypothetical protein
MPEIPEIHVPMWRRARNAGDCPTRRGELAHSTRPRRAAHASEQLLRRRRDSRAPSAVLQAEDGPLCSPSSKFLVVQRLLVEYTREGASRGRGRQRPAKRPTRAAHCRAAKFKRRRGGSSSVDSRSRSRGWGHRPRGQARSRSRCARRSPAALACTSRSRTSASIAASRSCAACACRSRSRLSSSIVASRFCAAPA